MKTFNNSQDLHRFYLKHWAGNKNPSAFNWSQKEVNVLVRLNEPLAEEDLTLSETECLEDALQSAYFSKTYSQAHAQLGLALANAKAYKAKPTKPYLYKKLNRNTFGTARLRGPHNHALMRHYLISAIYRVWRNEFGVEPRISRKIVAKDHQTMRSDFVVFGAKILSIVGIGKPEEHLTLYRSYESGVYQGLSYDD